MNTKFRFVKCIGYFTTYFRQGNKQEINKNSDQGDS